MTGQITAAFEELDACFRRAIADFETAHRKIEVLKASTSSSLETIQAQPYSREQLRMESDAFSDDSAVTHLGAQLASIVRTMAHDRSRLGDINRYRLEG